MPKPLKPQPEARIILRRGIRLDLKAVIEGIYIPRDGRMQTLDLVTGPHQEAIDRDVRNLKQQLERAGHQVNVIETSGV